jgi:hypothetical protein
MRDVVGAILVAAALLAVSDPTQAEPSNGRTLRAREARIVRLEPEQLRSRTLELEPPTIARGQVQSVTPTWLSTTYAASLVVTAATSAPNARDLLHAGANRWLGRPAIDPTSAASRTPLRLLAGIPVPTGADSAILVRPTASVDLSTLGMLARGSF